MNYAILNVKSLEQILSRQFCFTLTCIIYRFKFSQIHCICNEVLEGANMQAIKAQICPITLYTLPSNYSYCYHLSHSYHFHKVFYELAV